MGGTLVVVVKKLPLFVKKRVKKRIAILASGAGSNAQRIIEYFKENSRADVVIVGCNNPDALVLKKAGDLGVSSFVFNKSELTRLSVVLDKLLVENVDLVVLAGFLLKLPKRLVQAFPKRIINIHPSLCLSLAVKACMEKNVHRAVIDAQEKKVVLQFTMSTNIMMKGRLYFRRNVM